MDLAYLSQWSGPANLPYPAHHGEKSSSKQMENFGITNLEMEKERLLDIDVESLQLTCVNPYDVNPLTQQNTASVQISSTDVASKDEPSTSQAKSPATNCGGFYVPRDKKIKLEMEEFSDLSFYLHRRPRLQNSVDELNATYYDTNLPGYDLNFDFIKLESESYGNNILLNNISKTTNSIDIKKQNNNEYPISDIDKIQLQNSVTSVLLSPESDNGSVYDYPKSKSYNSGKTLNIIDRRNAVGLNCKTETAMYSNASSPSAADVQQLNSGVNTPDGSICSSNCPTPKLSLNVDLKTSANFDLTTPSIIEDVVELESVNFNLLDYMQSEAVSCETVNVEDLFEPSYSKPLLSGKGKEVKVTQLQPHIARKRPRKRRLPDDDDEDYVPPSERIAAKKRLPSEGYSDSDSDDEVEFERKVKNKTRGRPPKRTGSVSSDCSKDSDASKYRELRDKNNEASRRSRLKRKLKEQELESEADELHSKNIKLKAQVEELEKLVTKFREDLFKIMIRK